MNTQKPYYSNEVYLEELQSVLRKMENGPWNTLRRNFGKGVGGYENYDEYLSDIVDIKRAIETSELQVRAFAQMDENNKKFNEQFSNNQNK
jgi:hypothetical protein